MRCNINSRLYFAVANGAAPFLLIINTGSSKSDQVKLSINDIKLLQCIKDAHAQMARSVNPYGDGKASDRIVATLKGELIAEFQAA